MKWELTIPEGTTFQQWCLIADEAHTRRSIASWALVDLIIYANEAGYYNEAVAYLLQKGYRLATIRNWYRVGVTFSKKHRHANLSLSHHQLASGQGEKAEEWLKRAEKGDAGVPWSSDQLYSAIAEKKRPLGLSRPREKSYNRPHTDDPLKTFEQIAKQVCLTLREQSKSAPLPARERMLSRLDEVLRALWMTRGYLARTVNTPTNGKVMQQVR